ncbi:peptidoglycan bridge formation glycyltransferase FemA/FemB family protein [Sinomonas sp. JGH33]|uniref:Peptidoglycan bridge formation glycyltransferase FemA/FemB family protein n=1 Tax=Sinomonas terricola TaxID=3110330 RepID=A0ABU5T9L0_9MICC|nr:peptidoglycan bridge formation glycyltransferase FemA/FemB family protein [Sinomonas sp. JGH33]MEA5456207.1 peptidoglycan bridge formation glycyltransferase FemA/FemB family protein [Sinomonas sp. JGH33]
MTAESQLPRRDLTVRACTDRAEWDALVNSRGGHPLQLWGWGEVKAAHHWRTERLVVGDGAEVLGGAQVLYRALPWPLRSLAYLSRGPVCAPEDAGAVLDAVARHVRSTRGSVALVAEPDWDAGTDGAQSAGEQGLAAAGFARTENTILIPRTLILDLTQDDDALMAAMSRTTRANVRKNLKGGLAFRKVATEAELEQVLAIYRETARRAGFGIHEDRYYRDIWRLLGDDSPVVAAFDGDEVVAFVWIAKSAGTAFELYGGVNAAGQKARANYGVKWAAFTAMRADGCTRYDLNGLLNDGISDFKKQFAQHENLLAGTWELPLSPLYPMYSTGMPIARRTLQKGRAAAKAAVVGAKRAAGRARAFARR